MHYHTPNIEINKQISTYEALNRKHPSIKVETHRYYHQRRCPCVAYCTYCQGMHSNDGLLVLFVEDEVRLMRVLKGVDNTDNAG